MNNLFKTKSSDNLITKNLIKKDNQQIRLDNQNNELIFNINRSDIIEIINLINHYTFLLIESTKFNNLIKIKLDEKRTNIINLLNNLSIKKNQQQLDLKLSLKNKLIRNLNNNYELTKYVNLISEQIKNNLIDENNLLVNELLELKDLAEIRSIKSFNSTTANYDENKFNFIDQNYLSNDNLMNYSIDNKISGNHDLISDNGNEICFDYSIDSSYKIKFISDNEEIINQINTIQEDAIKNVPFLFSMRMIKRTKDLKEFDDDIVNYLKQNYILCKDAFVTIEEIFNQFNEHFLIRESDFRIKINLGKLIKKLFDTDHLQIVKKLRDKKNAYFNLKYIGLNNNQLRQSNDNLSQNLITDDNLSHYLIMQEDNDFSQNLIMQEDDNFSQNLIDTNFKDLT